MPITGGGPVNPPRTSCAWTDSRLMSYLQVQHSRLHIVVLVNSAQCTMSRHDSAARYTGRLWPQRQELTGQRHRWCASCQMAADLHHDASNNYLTHVYLQLLHQALASSLTDSPWPPPKGWAVAPNSSASAASATSVLTACMWGGIKLLSGRCSHTVQDAAQRHATCCASAAV